MEARREQIQQELLQTIRALPEDRLRQVVDFASFLGEKRASRRPQRGSAEALLKHAGSFQMEDGERDQLLSEIDHLRQLELVSDD